VGSERDCAICDREVESEKLKGKSLGTTARISTDRKSNTSVPHSRNAMGNPSFLDERKHREIGERPLSKGKSREKVTSKWNTLVETMGGVPSALCKSSFCPESRGMI